MKNVCVYDQEKDKLKRVTVNVTARDIAKGLTAKCDRCPVALAMLRLLSKEYTIAVGISSVRYCKNIEHLHEDCVYGPDMPLITTEFIRAFDSNRNPLPFKFKMRIPKMVLRHP